MRLRWIWRENKRSPRGVPIFAVGLRIGYWPCLRAPFISVSLGFVAVDVWYGLASYLKPARKPGRILVDREGVAYPPIVEVQLRAKKEKRHALFNL